MLFYIVLLLVSAVAAHYTVIILNQHTRIFSEGRVAEILKVKVMGTELERVVTKTYMVISSLVLFSFFSLVSIFVGTLIGMIIFINL